ncbi:alkaline phosphatase family protein [uncultured Pelagimonas sp.]|uniref:alkaline phosphatase family protein n=1 Tax=uncultured Pelagimonas sp. TaxID=1618102 RepID=UPI0026349C0B|nr:alkaline phosphatase family protein [uncultured Pelagimonas sp.]
MLTPVPSRHLIFALAGLSFFAQPALAQEPPRLVLQITVDQLRGDLIQRYSNHFGPDGFNRLIDSGTWFRNAHHRHSNTETIVGHTTLSTGTDPAVHGMVANLWFDRIAGTQFYNVQDPDYPLVGAEGIDKDSEIDPTQRAATTDGRSPRNILTSTISDEVALHFGPEAKVFGVSVKDRGAIAMAGHAGQAYWFSKSEGRFVTSSFYRSDYPDWVSSWNDSGKVAAYAGTDWALSGDASEYDFGTRDLQGWEVNLPGWGNVFPHNYGPVDNKYYTTLLTLSPAGDELTVDFAKTLIDAEGIGQDDITDYLSVSLSSTDYVGHFFTPSSLEAEDNLRRLDRTLAQLLDHVDQTVGIENTLIVLSADHGAADHPGYLKTLGIEAGSFSFDRLDTEPGLVRLKADFGASSELIKNFSNPYLYLDLDEIAARGLNLDEVEAAVAEELEKLPGIAKAVASSKLRRGEVVGEGVLNNVLANYHPDRSGNVYIVFEPHWFIADFDGLTVAAAHGSPWTYDTFVPILFAGADVPKGTVYRRVETVDVASTIAAYIGTKPPSGALGQVLPEIMPK